MSSIPVGKAAPRGAGPGRVAEAGAEMLTVVLNRPECLPKHHFHLQGKRKKTNYCLRKHGENHLFCSRNSL